MPVLDLACGRAAPAGARAAQVRLLRPTVFVFVLGMFFGCISLNVADVDIWHLMSLARETAALGSVPHADRFAYTPTVSPSVQHEWGSGMILYYVALHAGAPGLLVLKYALALAIAVLCFLAAKRFGATVIMLGFLAPPAIWLLRLGFAPLRPQVYSFVLFAALLCLFEIDRRGGRLWMAGWLAAFVLWTNLHGGCVVGIIAVGIYWAERMIARKANLHLPGLMAGMILAMAVNPYGLHYYGYLLKALAMDRPGIVEWGPVWRGLPVVYPAVFVACLLIAVYALWRRDFLFVPGAGLVAAMAFAASVHMRMLPFFAIAWICYVPGWLGQRPAAKRVESLVWRRFDVFFAAWACAGMLFLCLAVSERFWELRVPAERTDAPSWYPTYPAGAVDHLAAQRFRGNLMTPFAHGAYVSWRLHPDVRVSMDTRYEVAYPPALVAEHFRFYGAAPGWQSTLAAYPTDVVLIPRRAAVAALMPESGWSRAYVDAEFELWARPGVKLAQADWTGRKLRGTFP